ncbi:MAG: putative glycolipid-binding domain-containing protein [Chloroflexota bacterium]|nr:putative glycolipid-binding domain-containing protein [Chloroflexota bacterium]
MPTTNKGTLVVEGAYTHHHGDTATGHETWQLHKLAHGGMVFTSRVEWTAPQVAALNFTFEISQHWAPVHFAARRDEDGKTLSTEQRAADAQWRAHIETRGETPTELALDFSGKHEIGFASPLHSAVTLVRLNLQVGKSQDADAIWIDPKTFTPRAAKSKYTCIGEEKIEVPAGKYSAWHYSVQSDGAEALDHLWADRNGVVLLYQSALGDAAKLARYRRIERR